MTTLALILTLQLGQYSSPVGEGVSVWLAHGPLNVLQSVEGIGGYCSLSGCTMGGGIRFAQSSGYALSIKSNVGIKLASEIGSGTLATIVSTATPDIFITANGNNFVFRASSTFDAPGAVAAAGLVSSSRNANPAVQCSGTGWYETAGDTAANIATRTPTAGSGAWIYDDTNNCNRMYQNGAWTTGCIMYAPAIGTTYFPSHFMMGWCGIGAACSEDVNFLGTMATSSSRGWDRYNVRRVACNWGVAGTGGTTGVVVQVYNLSTAAEICSCTLGACTTSAFTNLDCACTASLTDNQHDFAIRLKNTTDCTADPQYIACNVSGDAFIAQP